MLGIPGYQCISEIYNSSTSIVYRAINEIDNKPVVIKRLNEEHPSLEKLKRFKHEYEILRSLDLNRVVKTYGLEQYCNSYCLFVEDFGGDSLSILDFHGKLPLDQFLLIAIQCVDSLQQIHSKNVIHKDINPFNIVYNRESQQLKLIDFGIAAVLSREVPTIRDTCALEGTLAYISPEQTGRMNRAVDYRTDFYSLGVTFYELLTGRLPFEVHDDPMELVYRHIATEPLPPHGIDSRVPVPLSGIVVRLLRKDADERYRSALGIKVDLEECLRQFSSGGEVRELVLGAKEDRKSVV